MPAIRIPERRQWFSLHLWLSSAVCSLVLYLRWEATRWHPLFRIKCAYFEYYFRNGASVASVALPSLLPTPISSACLAAYRATNSSALCKAECRSLYSAISECESPSLADDFSAQYCGRVNNSYCSALKDYGLVSAIYSNCGYAPASASCSSSCKSSIAALQNFSGCCRAYILNSAKLQCGQQTIAPCSSVFNSGPVVVPKDECTNFRMYGPNSWSTLAALIIPLLDTKCITAVKARGFGSVGTCIPECQPLYSFIENCEGAITYNSWTTLFCGTFTNQSCSNMRFGNNRDKILDSLSTSVATSCADSTYCSPSCLAAITVLEKYAGCCYADELNGPKVLCGQQPIPYCSTPVNSIGSAAIMNAFPMVSTIAINVAATYTLIAASLIFWLFEHQIHIYT